MDPPGQALVSALLGLMLTSTWVCAANATDPTFRARLALRHAPIHHQAVNTRGKHSLGGAADFMTKFDFDFDKDASNNWDNAGDPRYPLSAHAYYSLVETSTHWFITYQFFHPRDWSSTFFETEHENDSEGLLLIVARDGSQQGTLRAAISVVHSHFYSYVPKGSPYGSGRENVDGTLIQQEFQGELHPLTAQQAETHALKAWPNYCVEGQGVVYYPSLSQSEVPIGPNDRQVMYQLHDLLEPDGLWQHRRNPRLFARYGAFAGNTSGGCGQGVFACQRDAAHAPWAWNDRDDGSPRGAMASSPAALVLAYFQTHERVSLVYSFNPFR